MTEEKKYRTALIVGRFQPFHKGHLYLLREVAAMADHVVLAIGSAGESGTIDNPLSFAVRQQILEKVIATEGLSEKVLKIVPSYDFPSDQEWVDKLIAAVGDFDVVVGNNEWTNSVLEAAGYQAKTIPLANREEWQGMVIRELMRNGREEWKNHVPFSLIAEISDLF
ncbi:adenylyltransferase/cytidyltransferase family protein [Candidatus Woesebacteria bacterium]|nr:adenylyltransferase/cytidyltransferase family protein [Candidatus Woesebacteria bacterium]MCD8506959.1 adenylyltransferase/cytidyltransferase family protein [Candidatus Woesebacteria bacterium]MCD8527250.1 adenylyltransferase/cytidyltransferase family protein [Candidatus Woesebacteria bacterium]MCD8546617.1 adenylyltransferase/cytidyltransferase family protein [Candidatus Woesebacteria bacterium]